MNLNELLRRIENIKKELFEAMRVVEGVKFTLEEFIVKRVDQLCHNRHLVVDIEEEIEDIKVAVRLIYDVLTDVIILKKELEKELEEKK
jgi:hypothetical protein